MKALDIVRTPAGAIALVLEAGKGGVAISFLKGCDPTGEYNAWWNPEDLTVLDSIPRLLANAMAHPFGENTKQGDRHFGGES